MDIFVPWQCSLLRDCYNNISVARIRYALGPWTGDDKSELQGDPVADEPTTSTEICHSASRYGELSNSALAALGVIASLNVPPFLYVRQQLAVAHIEARNGWPGKWARWMSYVSTSRSQRILDFCVEMKWTGKISAVLHNTMITGVGMRKGRWWTVLSSNFLHLHASHYRGTVSSLLWFGTLCARVPGMGWKEMLGLATASGLGASVGFLLYIRSLEHRMVNEHVGGMGLSGIVCGFAAVSALGAPRERVRISSARSYGVRWLSSILPLFSITTDVAGLLTRAREDRGMVVGYAPELAGMAAGAAFYLYVLYGKRNPHAQPIVHDLRPAALTKKRGFPWKTLCLAGCAWALQRPEVVWGVPEFYHMRRLHPRCLPEPFRTRERKFEAHDRPL